MLAMLTRVASAGTAIEEEALLKSRPANATIRYVCHSTQDSSQYITINIIKGRQLICLCVCVCVCVCVCLHVLCGTCTYMSVCMSNLLIMDNNIWVPDICITYIMPNRYVWGIKHKTRGRVAPEGECFISHMYCIWA